MRKYLFIFIMFCVALKTMAQETVLFPGGSYPAQHDMRTEALKQLSPRLQSNDISLKLRFFRQSQHSKHYTYDVLYKSIPVFANHVKVNTDSRHRILSVAIGVGDKNKWSQSPIQQQVQFWQQQKLTTTHWQAHQIIKKAYPAIYEWNNQVAVVQVQEAWSKTYDKTKIISLNNELIETFNHERHLGIDTFINANVFEPDPITFLSQVYASPYVDSNDQNLNWMTAAYLPVNIPAVYDTFVNKFFIESDYVKMADFESPNIPPSSSTNNNFYFNRSQAGFEECMVAYHINTYHSHLTNLGYDTLMDLQLEADAHGQFGADNSVFIRNGNSPTIVFGDGGIDDAEDADVIIHEYSHGISWSANANLFIGNERTGLDEGIADYFATSYSRHLSPFNWQKVFNWDGNNGPWQGRTAISTAQYSSPFPGNIYSLGEVWNAAMQKIYTDLGRDTTDALMLETLFFLTDNTGLPGAARYMIQADSLLFGGINVNTLCQHFSSNGILAWNCYPNGISNPTINQRFATLANSYQFALGTANAVIALASPQSAQYQIFGINGQIIQQESNALGRFELQPTTLKAGVYVIRVQTARGNQVFKLLRH